MTPFRQEQTLHHMADSKSIQRLDWVTIVMQATVSENLLDRLEDCKRQFPVAAILGGAGAQPVSNLSHCSGPFWCLTMFVLLVVDSWTSFWQSVTDI